MLQKETTSVSPTHVYLTSARLDTIVYQASADLDTRSIAFSLQEKSYLTSFQQRLKFSKTSWPAREKYLTYYLINDSISYVRKTSTTMSNILYKYVCGVRCPDEFLCVCSMSTCCLGLSRTMFIPRQGPSSASPHSNLGLIPHSKKDLMGPGQVMLVQELEQG